MTRRLGLFLGATALFSAPFWWLYRATGFGGFTPLLMWCPGLAAVVALKLTGGSRSALGWRASSVRWVGLSWAVAWVGLAAAYGVACALGAATFPGHTFLDKVSSAWGFHGAPLAVPLVLQWVSGALVEPLSASGRALGEELGWRGLFAPEACGRFGFIRGSLLVGGVWALWHFPLMLGETSVVGLVNFTCMVVGTGFGFVWFRLKSDSVWPSVVWHGTHNAFRAAFLAPLTVASSPGSLWLGETGYALAGLGLVMVAVFVTLHVRRISPVTVKADWAKEA
jgi:membrane protease YdiL (CAAX protease family)